jgi:hypothetical protein
MEQVYCRHLRHVISNHYYPLFTHSYLCHRIPGANQPFKYDSSPLTPCIWYPMRHLFGSLSPAIQPDISLYLNVYIGLRVKTPDFDFWQKEGFLFYTASNSDQPCGRLNLPYIAYRTEGKNMRICISATHRLRNITRNYS